MEKVDLTKRREQKEIIKKVFKSIGKYRIYILLSILLAFVTVCLTLYVPILIGQAIDSIVEGNVNFERIAHKLMIVIIIVLITGLAQWLMNMLNNKVTYHVVRDMRNAAFKKIEVLPLKYLDNHSQGELVSRIIADVDQLADGLLMGLTQLFTGVITILGTLFFMASINIWIAMVVVAITPLSLFVASYIAKKTYHMFTLQSKTRGEQTALINEMIGNEKVVKAYGHEKAALEQFDEINERLGKYSLRAIFFSSITNPCTRFVNGVVYTAVALTGSLVALGGNMTIGALSCFLSYANQYTKPFNEISGVVTEFQNAIACAGRIFELIEAQEQIADPVDAEDIEAVQGHVICQNVDFSYVPDKKLIQDFNINIKPGQKVAIVGPTGCGKTTLINLLMRFYEVNAGQIIIDDREIRTITRQNLRTSFGMVLQDTWLKKGTIKDNIKMGKADATDEEIIEAAKASHAHSFIKRLPNGYDTVIGEDGGILSVGQKQLLCITRVMLYQPSMLILDEATSSIDTRTEIKVQRAFNKLMEGRTSFIVAHRLSTIQNADIILVMQDGKIIEQGKHQELLEKDGFYTKLYNSQFALNEAE